MLIYTSEKLFKAYGIQDDLDSKVMSMNAIQEKSDPLQEWVANLFYFNRKKCLEICHPISGFTLFFIMSKKIIWLLWEL